MQTKRRAAPRLPRAKPHAKTLNHIHHQLRPCHLRRMSQPERLRRRPKGHPAQLHPQHRWSLRPLRHPGNTVNVKRVETSSQIIFGCSFCQHSTLGNSHTLNVSGFTEPALGLPSIPSYDRVSRSGSIQDPRAESRRHVYPAIQQAHIGRQSQAGFDSSAGFLILRPRKI